VDVRAGGLAGADAVEHGAPDAPHRGRAVVERAVADRARRVAAQVDAERGKREGAVGELLEHADAGQSAQQAPQRGRVGRYGGGERLDPLRPGGEPVGEAEDGGDVERLLQAVAVKHAEQRLRRVRREDGGRRLARVHASHLLVGVGRPVRPATLMLSQTAAVATEIHGSGCRIAARPSAPEPRRPFRGVADCRTGVRMPTPGSDLAVRVRVPSVWRAPLAATLVTATATSRVSSAPGGAGPNCSAWRDVAATYGIAETETETGSSSRAERWSAPPYRSGAR
jgi:hypothetical protein